MRMLKVSTTWKQNGQHLRNGAAKLSLAKSWLINDFRKLSKGMIANWVWKSILNQKFTIRR